MRPAAPPRRLVDALAAASVWAAAVPYVAAALGLDLGLPGSLEVADHVVPGLVALVGWLVLAGGLGGTPGALAAAGVAALAGLWITATHVPLVIEAVDGVSPWGPALLHLSAGPPVLAIALALILRSDGHR